MPLHKRTVIPQKKEVGRWSTMTLELVHPRETLKVLIWKLVRECRLFTDNLMLVGAPYSVRAPVSVDDFRLFVSALEDKPVEVTNSNFGGLSLLCDEFGFAALSERLSAFRRSPDFKDVTAQKDSEERLRLSALEERLLLRDQEFALRHSQIERQNARIEALEKQFGEHSQRFQAQESTAAALADAIVRLSRIEVQFAHTQSVSSPKATETPRVPALVRTTPPSAKAGGTALDSEIISDFPEIFAEFRGKRFSLLWRGGRDGFGARDFHGRCDGHANTLTLIEDTDGNIFGAFTPLEWESRNWNGINGKGDNCYKADPSLKSFIFTLKNPHNVPARRFALKAEKKNEAIYCDSENGPDFNDITVKDNCNAGTDSYNSLFGERYTNDTGLGGEPPENTFFTGSEDYQVKEIEVFEITN
jgi:hypothetical protein